MRGAVEVNVDVGQDEAVAAAQVGAAGSAVAGTRGLAGRPQCTTALLGALAGWRPLA